MKRWVSVLVLGIIFILFACNTTNTNPYVKMDVTSYRDPGVDLKSKKTFAIVTLDKKNPLLEKELLYMIKDEMERNGYIYDGQNPDIIITLFYYVGPIKYYVPPSTYKTLEYVPGKTKNYSGWIDGKYVSLSEYESGHLEEKTHSTSGYNKVEFYRHITIDIWIDGKEKSLLVWSGEADSFGSNSDIRKVAPYMIKEVLLEFPEKSGKLEKRIIPLLPKNEIK